MRRGMPRAGVVAPCPAGRVWRAHLISASGGETWLGASHRTLGLHGRGMGPAVERLLLLRSESILLCRRR